MGEGRDEREDWKRSEGRDSAESMPTPVLEKNQEERGASGEECSHLDSGRGKGVPDWLPAPTSKDGETGYHTTGEVLHRTPMFINKMIKLGLKQIEPN